jgi:hypothetical protein
LRIARSFQVVIDPPFVQEACWRAYAKTAQLLLREDPLAAAAALRAAPAVALSVAEAEGTSAAASAPPAAPAREATGRQASGGRGGLVLLTTILENAPLLEELLGVKPNAFRPSIPNLVYQYHIFTNYPSVGLAAVNTEVGE